MRNNEKVIKILKNLRKNKESITIEKIQNEYIQLYESKITSNKIRKILNLSNYRSLKNTNSLTWNGKTYFHKSDVIQFLEEELENINETYPDLGFAVMASSAIKDLLSSFCIKSIDIFLCSEVDINYYSSSYIFYKMKIILINPEYKNIIKDKIKKIQKKSNLKIKIVTKKKFLRIIYVHSDYKNDILSLKNSLDSLNSLWFDPSASMSLKIPFDISLPFEKYIEDFEDSENFEGFDPRCYSTIRERFIDYLEKKYPIDKNSKENDKIPESSESAESSESGES